MSQPDATLDELAMEFAIMRLDPEHSREIAFNLFNEMTTRYGVKEAQAAMTRARGLLKIMGT